MGSDVETGGGYTGYTLKSNGSIDTLTRITRTVGGSANDFILGTPGDDDLQGEGGSDIINGRSGYDYVGYSSFNGLNQQLHGATVDLTLGTATDAWISGTDTLINIEGVFGTNFGDTLTGIDLGYDSRSMLQGLGGADILRGAGSGFTAADYNVDTAAVTVNLQTGTATDGTGATDTLVNINAVRGSAYDDNITGSTGDDWLTGGTGNDTISGLDGADRLSGDAGNDTLNGGAGADTLYGGTGMDTMSGGTGADRFIFAATGTESSRAAQDVITDFSAADGDSFGRTPGSSAWLFWGGELAAAYGSLNTDIVLGSPFVAPTGLSGHMTYWIAHTSLGGWVVVDENDDGVLQAGEFTVRVASDATGASVTYNGGNAVVSAMGTQGDNVFFLSGPAGSAALGLGGNDIFYGSAGVDAMAGGAGNDQYVVRDLRSILVENADDGYDIAWFGVSDATNGANIEEGRLFGTAQLLHGSDTSEQLVANPNAFSTVFGNGGDDTLWGSNFAGGPLLTNAATGGTFNAAGEMHGGTGDDIFRDQGGAFAMYGDEGNDQYAVNNINSLVTEYVNGGIDTVWLAVNGYTLTPNIEIARLAAPGAVLLHGSDTGENLVANQAEGSTLYGNGGNDVLWGGAHVDTMYGGEGDDIMRGQGGADIMLGGTGNDQYVVYSSAAIVTELAGEGYDIVYAGGAGTLNLGQDIEEGRLFDQGTGLIGGNGAELLVGNNAGLASTIQGNGGNDTIWGTAAADILSGGAGNDTIYAMGGADIILIDVLDWGVDLVAGFSQESGAKLRFAADTGVTAFNQLTVSYGDGNTVIANAHGNATIFGATLTSADFIFG